MLIYVSESCGLLSSAATSLGFGLRGGDGWGEACMFDVLSVRFPVLSSDPCFVFFLFIFCLFVVTCVLLLQLGMLGPARHPLSSCC